MKSRRHWELAAAIAAALWMTLVFGSEARAERLWTERAAEMRASPGDDSQELRKVPKGKSVEVIKRLGTWVMVQYDGRKGWIRRTALSAEPVSGSGGDEDEAAEEKSEKKGKKKGADAEEEDAEEAESDDEPKAAAGGAKRTAAKKKADRKKSRKARHSKAESRDDEEEAEEEEDAKPRKARSTWGARGRVAGGPLKVEIQALSVQAFSEPDGTGNVVFTVSEGERVRVIARGENRWLLVENSKKKTGWIPAFAVRDNGELPEARKSASKSKADEGESEDEEAPDAEEEEVAEKGSKKGKSRTKTAAASDDEEESTNESEESEEEDSGSESKSSGDDVDATLDSSSSDEFTTPRKDWTATASFRAGYTSLGMDVTPTGQAAQAASYSGPTASLIGEIDYRLRPKIAILGELAYDWSTALGGLGVTPDGGAELDGGSVMSHRIGVSAGVGYGKRMVGSLRLGYQYAIFQISDLANAAEWPRESTSGPTAGLGFAYPEVAGTKIGLKLGVDALLFGSRTQTQGLRDGAELDSLTALWGTLRLDYPIGQHLVVDGGYRFGYAKASWTGLSDRTGAMATDRKDQAHEISLGVGWRL